MSVSVWNVCVIERGREREREREGGRERERERLGSAPRKRSCVRNLPGPSVTLMSGAPPRLALES